jgi:hypothetical protein
MSNIRVLTVGIDASTIAGCIALCTNPSISNSYIIRIPPGVYTENLTIPGAVHLQGMCNPMDNVSTRLTGQHTITGTNVNALNNRVSISNLLMTSADATTALLSISGTTATEVQISGCYLQNVNSATTSKIFNVGSNGTLYVGLSRVAMASAAGTGGTHVVLSGGNFYTYSYLTVDGGTRFLDMTTATYAQIVNTYVNVNGSDIIRIAASGLVFAGYSSFTNNATVGNGVNLLGANASMGANNCTFSVLNDASTYVVTGPSGSAFLQVGNNYAHIAGVVTRNVKIKNTVSLLTYTSALTPSA